MKLNQYTVLTNTKSIRRSFSVITLLLLFIHLYRPAAAQDVVLTRVLTLPAAVALAQEQSPSFRYASVLLENKQWQYRTYRSNFFPQLNLSGVLPEYNKTIEPRLTDNGSLIFINTHNANSSLQLSLQQEVWFTGATISINSQIKRIDDFQADVNRTRYSSVPATITLNQPFFGYNYRAWERKVAPLRYQEAKRDYWEAMEDIAKATTDHFFNLLLSQKSYEIAEKNVANSDTLYKVALARFEQNKIRENELLQMELTLLNARQNLEQAALDVESNTLKLKVYLGITDDEPISLVPPQEIPDFDVDEKVALAEAHKNRQQIIGFKRELLEADMRMAQAKGQTGFRADLYASFGLTQQALEIDEAYLDPSQQQRFRLGFNLPVVDWDRTASQIGTAKANQSLVRANVEQQRINFDQEIYLNVKRFKVLRKQMIGAKRADEIAEKRYSITKSSYLSGEIDIISLNVATEERDQATRSYISALWSFWSAYYNLRRLTLYDFEHHVPLILDS
ncbi:TolC family protein [Pontibacter sp. 172403-2]|uniref:TolC family protein n=1 Tax=Pontibacter rufus TaxID=2791028 RepID=UPI0018AF78B6|nr:TolC family protein [Pontibacter sp. 172403-2]MBF9254655.1 TolC family protein [Pontibacter sp. 172403-2]